MQIHLNLFASLARYKAAACGDGSWDVDCEEGATIGDVLQKIGVPMDQVKLIFLNGVHANTANRLQNGDRLGVFPPVGGG